MSAPGWPGTIGQAEWPGLLKLAEESGEVTQTVGKLLAYPRGDHPDGGPSLVERIQNEIADVLAAADFVIYANGLDNTVIHARYARKLAIFGRWHADGLNT